MDSIGNVVMREKEWHNKFGVSTRDSQQKFYSVFDESYQFMNEIVVSKLTKNTELLGYGCGNGSYLMNICDKIKWGGGIDISERFLEEAKKTAEERNIKNLDFFCQDAMHTNFEDGKFDVIQGHAILHHLDIELSLIEIKRLLKSSGSAIFQEPLGTNPIISLYRKLTPHARTADEHPLLKKDIDLIMNIFPNTKIYYFNFVTLLAVPFRNMKFFRKLLSILQAVDRVLLNSKSPLKKFAWLCVLILKK